MTKFTALQDFPSPEMQSVYAKGLSYTIRSATEIAARLSQQGHAPAVIAAAVKRAEQLPGLVARWVAEGKVMMGGLDAEIAGVGDAAPAPGDTGGEG